MTDTPTQTTATMLTANLILRDTWRIRVVFADGAGPVNMSAGGFIPMADVMQVQSGYEWRCSGKNVIAVDQANGVFDFVLTPPPFPALRSAGSALAAPIRVAYYLVDTYGNRTTYLIEEYTPIDLATVDLSTVALGPVTSYQVKALTPIMANNTSPTDPGQEQANLAEDGGFF